MTKLVQAYFPTESDAVSAQTRLLADGATGIEVSSLEGVISRDVPLIAPYSLGAMNGSATYGTGVPAASPAPVVFPVTRDGVAPADIADEDRQSGAVSEDLREDGKSGRFTLDLFEGDRDGLTHVLVARVPEESYEEIIDHIRANNGYVANLEE